MRLSQIGVGPEQLNAVFFTHMHNDHTEGFADLVQLRWSFHGTGPKIDAVCSSDIVSPQGFTISCRKFVTHIADAFIQSGEIAQRHSELASRTAGGPAELVNTIPSNRTRPTVARLGNGAALDRIAGRSLRWHQAEIRHQLARRSKPRIPVQFRA